MSRQSTAAAVFGALALFVGLAASWKPPVGLPETIVLADHPVAVLAWAKANCYDGLVLRSDAPRTHSEILLQVAGIFQAVKSKRKIAALCAEALDIAKPMIAKRSLPEFTGASPLYDRLATAAR